MTWKHKKQKPAHLYDDEEILVSLQCTYSYSGLKKRTKPTFAACNYKGPIRSGSTKTKALKNCHHALYTDSQWRRLETGLLLDYFYCLEPSKSVPGDWVAYIGMLPLAAWESFSYTQKRDSAGVPLQLHIVDDNTNRTKKLEEQLDGLPYIIALQCTTHCIIENGVHSLEHADVVIVHHQGNLNGLTVVDRLQRAGNDRPKIVVGEEINRLNQYKYSKINAVNYVIRVPHLAIDPQLLTQPIDDAFDGKQGVWNQDFVRP